jgi:hypothetical protein
MKLAALAAAIALGVGAVPAQAATVSLTLGAVHTGADILNFYNGGNDSVPNDGTGPNLGIAFSANATAQKAGNSQTTGAGKFENNPSGQTEILYFSSSTSTSSYLNYASGFSGLSFNYSLASNSPNYDATVSLYSGLNGTGILLDTLSLSAAATSVGCTVRTDAYCTWSAASTGATNFGTAQSVVFGTNSTTPYTEFDGVQLTPASPVPLPAAAWLMLSGLGSLCGVARRRQIVAA